MSQSSTWSPSEVRAWTERHGGNITALARRLRVGRTRLQGWMSDAASARPVPPYVQVAMELMDEVTVLRGEKV